MTGPRRNHLLRTMDVTELSQRMKFDRNFLKWMARRHKTTNLEQSEAFDAAAEMLEKLRNEIVAGGFSGSEDLFTPPSSGYTQQCAAEECLAPAGHQGLHRDAVGQYFYEELR